MSGSVWGVGTGGVWGVGTGGVWGAGEGGAGGVGDCGAWGSVDCDVAKAMRLDDCGVVTSRSRGDQSLRDSRNAWKQECNVTACNALI